jgi:hypothetical protein
MLLKKLTITGIDTPKIMQEKANSLISLTASEKKITDPKSPNIGTSKRIGLITDKG